MRNPLRRYYGRGDLHFVTFSCYQRRALLGTAEARDFFVMILDEVRAHYGFRLAGYVVMPEHVHLLMSEAKEANPSIVLQVLKQRVSRGLRGGMRGKPEGWLSPDFAGMGEKDEHFWERRFYDFNVWSEGKVREKIEYMHANPVARGLVEHPGEWRWSSWSEYEKGERGLIRIDAV